MNKIVIITPAYRINNLQKIKESINFNKIFKWIIIYDKEKNFKGLNKSKDNSKIIELYHKSKNKENQGNAQRNKGLEFVNKNFSKYINIFIYFLDDDNIIHENFYSIARNLRRNRIYTFDQQRPRYVLSGKNPKVFYIDLAMFISDFSLIKSIRFRNYDYNADGLYIEECYKKNKINHIFLKKIGCYYNYLSRNKIRRISYRIMWFFKNFFISSGLKKEIIRYKP